MFLVTASQSSFAVAWRRHTLARLSDSSDPVKFKGVSQRTESP